jgi:aldose 1-epimerase
MNAKGEYCFTHLSGEDIYLFALCNARGTEVLISNYGAIISSFKIKNAEGIMNDIVLGFDKMEDYFSPDYLRQYPWFGCAVGRYANRIKNAVIEIDGKPHCLTPNRGYDQLHGGENGFDRRVWQFVSSGTIPQSFLELKYNSVDGEEGYPGNLEVLIRFELNDENELSYQYTATCDQPTAINLTHHSYFNLNNGCGTIDDQEIKIHASTFLGQDDKLVADGKLIPVANTLFDLTNFSKIGQVSGKLKEYDKSFLVDKKAASVNRPELLLVAEARSAQTNILLQVYSTEPVVHFYSGKWTPVVRGKNGNRYGPFSGFCLETHQHPNAINIPHFPDTILRPGETYHHKTIYKVIG